ncbi:MAG TPA: DUF433 domain-containing protein [Bryobacteraceae bacterium]
MLTVCRIYFVYRAGSATSFSILPVSSMRDTGAMAESIIVRDPDILGCEPVFRGTRVPFQALLDYLQSGRHNPKDFLDDFPTVSRDMAVAALEEGIRGAQSEGTRANRLKQTSLTLGAQYRHVPSLSIRREVNCVAARFSGPSSYTVPALPSPAPFLELLC